MALSEAYPYPHEFAVSVGDPGGEAMVKEWEHVEDGLEEGMFRGLGLF